MGKLLLKIEAISVYSLHVKVLGAGDETYEDICVELHNEDNSIACLMRGTYEQTLRVYFKYNKVLTK